MIDLSEWTVLSDDALRDLAKSKRMVLVTDGQFIYIAFYDGSFWDDGDSSSGMSGMTHWMELPSLPQSQAQWMIT